MTKFAEKGKEPERLPTPDEIKEAAKTHPGCVALIAPPGVTAASGCKFEGRLCWAPPEIAEELVKKIHGFERSGG